MTHSIESSWHSERVVQISFRDPARRNQISWAAIDELGETLRSCREQGARVVVLSSSLEGHWLEHAWLQDLVSGVEGASQTGSGSGWLTVLDELGHEEIVSIAAVSGDSSGGGAEIGWACDMRLAEEQARFSQPEVNLGLTTGIGGCSRLVRLAGRSTAAEMVLTGKPVSAQRLYELGAVNRVVARGESIALAVELGHELAKKSWLALQGLKRILAVSDTVGLDEALAREQGIFQQLVVTDDALSGMKDAQKHYDQGISVAGYNRYEE